MRSCISREEMNAEDMNAILELFLKHADQLRSHSLLKSKNLKINTSVTLQGTR